MSFIVAAPEVFDSAATDLGGIAATLNEAHASAAARTTGIVAAAEDEVSAAMAALFSGHAQAFQALSTQAAAFHQEFLRALTTGAGAYAGAEAANAGQLLTGGSVPLAGPSPNPTTGVALIMGGSGTPIPPQDFITANFNLYIKPLFPNVTPQALFTPEGNYGLYTGVRSLTLNASTLQGVTILDDAIRTQLGLNPNQPNPYPSDLVVVKGESQSSTISSVVMPLLASQGVPSHDVSFVLTGDPNNPNGGLFQRLVGLSIPSLGITFNGATPSNLYPTTIYTQEYDGFADVPQYPINLLSDLNSLAGIYYVHPTYSTLTPQQVSSGFLLPGSEALGTPNSMTNYYMIPTQNLPLLDPLRAIPVVGNPLADLVQPDLRVLVNLGYGNPNYGWSQGPANVPTSFGLFPPLHDVAQVPGLLVTGTHQGITAFAHDVSGEFSSAGSLLPSFSSPGSLLPSLSSLAAPSSGPPAISTMLPSPVSLLSAISPVSIAGDIENTVNALSAAASHAYALLLPTADVANALVTALPAYDLTLFAEGLQAGNLVEAIGLPIAVDTYLIPLAGAFELFATVSQASSVIGALEGIFTGVVPGLLPVIVP
jgi:hypothetical protein